jgi:serine/threonine protein kinase
MKNRIIAGRYHVLAQLAEGGMGVTFRAWDAEGQRPVVVKEPKRPRNDPDGKVLNDRVTRFRREIKAMQSVRHAHVVTVLDSGEDDGLPFIVMRLLPGGSLADRRRREFDSQYHPLPLGHLHPWLPQVASALDHIHSQGMMHRDVKPTNIFFDADGQAFLGDFGIAKPLDPLGAKTGETLTATHMAIGTPEYMAPEVYVVGGKPSGAVDQYALAITVYEVISGCRPFSGLLGQSIIVEHATAPIPPLDSNLPSSLRAAIERGLAKKPEDRFSTCREFADAVLKDVSPLVDKVPAKRLLCPNPDCHKLLVMPGTEGGKRGSCPGCHIQVEVSRDFTALLLQSEVESTRPRRGFFDTWDGSWVCGRDLGEVDPEIIGGFAKKSSQSLRKFISSLAIHLRQRLWLLALALGERLWLLALALGVIGVMMIAVLVAGWISGGERNGPGVVSDPLKKSAPPSDAPAGQPASSPPDDPIVGEWDWNVGGNYLGKNTFLAGGRIEGTDDGRWVKYEKDGRSFYVIYWPITDEYKEKPFVDTLEMEDSNYLCGSNNDGAKVIGELRQP